MREWQRVARLLALGTPGAAIFAVFFLLPLVMVGGEAFSDHGAAFARLAQLDLFWPGLANSLLLGLAAGAISLAGGLMVAWRLSQMNAAARTALLFLIALPLTFSGLVVAFGFILAFGRAGFVTLSLERLFGVDPAWFASLVYSPTGLALVYSYYLIPRVVMLMLPVFANFDRVQLAAAESLGAGRWRAIADVLVPQVLPTALAAFCLVVAVAFGAYGTALALVGSQVNILPLQLFTLVSDAGTDFPLAAALALVLTALCTAAMSVGEVVVARRQETVDDR
ncbi:ABC transporter permease [Blastochloris viridis]|uniref:Molybdenum transport system permease protein ModB n=1 Tax=Blastochloris viridis TaxID=1079 RepID=A0A0H5BBW5_BLAVI|nr:ABC transporter permease subunit [Blastochloris viridis]ALK10314.1 Spermidine/putrescine transport system permease protein PotB [Blastochloris viridis]BAR99752.1 molybdenum transport system permease protein ModB [Blastochloris viridis]CUU42976.1 Spermidine/putrescine transport system permease protein PotB [Blastochloris viridis]